MTLSTWTVAAVTPTPSEGRAPCGAGSRLPQHGAPCAWPVHAAGGRFRVEGDIGEVEQFVAMRASVRHLDRVIAARMHQHTLAGQMLRAPDGQRANDGPQICAPLGECVLGARRMYTDHPPRAEYALTERGTDLRTVVRALTIWGSKHLPGERVLVHTRCDHPIEMAYRCAHCDELLDLADIAFHTEATPERRAPARRRAPHAAAVSTRRRKAPGLPKASA